MGTVFIVPYVEGLNSLRNSSRQGPDFAPTLQTSQPSTARLRLSRCAAPDGVLNFSPDFNSIRPVAKILALWVTPRRGRGQTRIVSGARIPASSRSVRLILCRINNSLLLQRHYKIPGRTPVKPCGISSLSHVRTDNKTSGWFWRGGACSRGPTRQSYRDSRVPCPRALLCHTCAWPCLMCGTAASLELRRSRAVWVCDCYRL